MDWQMPGIDGIDTVRQMRQQIPHTASTPVVMVSGCRREKFSTREAEQGANISIFLVKPVTASMMAEAAVAARLTPLNAASKPSVPAKAQRLEGLRLLVVEDNLLNQQIAKELLIGEGAVVETAENGRLGVDAIYNSPIPFDAVLMDIQMPVMDGYEATRYIRNTLMLPTLPIIALTANALASDRDACIAAGMNAHVGKPYKRTHKSSRPVMVSDAIGIDCASD
jgi:two-component system, sensor histidine kinase and response regulator